MKMIEIPEIDYIKMCEAISKPPIMIVPDVETALKSMDLSPGAINKVRGFTIEGFEKLEEKYNRLKDLYSELLQRAIEEGIREDEDIAIFEDNF